MSRKMKEWSLKRDLTHIKDIRRQLTKKLESIRLVGDFLHM